MGHISTGISLKEMAIDGLLVFSFLLILEHTENPRERRSPKWASSASFFFLFTKIKQYDHYNKRESTYVFNCIKPII